MSKLEMLEQKQTELSERQQDSGTEMELLRKHRAKLVLSGKESNKKRIASLDKQINSLTQQISNTPSEHSYIDEEIKKEQERIAKRDMDRLLAEQKSVAGQMKEFSAALSQLLEKAVAVNSKLLAANVRYRTLYDKTGANLASKFCSQGSYQFLQVVYDYISKETAGEVVLRPTMRPPFSRV